MLTLSNLADDFAFFSPKKGGNKRAFFQWLSSTHRWPCHRRELPFLSIGIPPIPSIAIRVETLFSQNE
jgi:hypothetical protein